MATQKQKRLARELVKNLGAEETLTGGQLLEKAGYSEGLQRYPNRVISQQGVQDELDRLLPDELLADKHLALLNKQEVRIKNNVTTGDIEVIPTGEIDVQAVKAGLDMAYKLKGKYAPEKRQTENLNVNLDIKSTPKEQKIVKNAEEELMKLYGEK